MWETKAPLLRSARFILHGAEANAKIGSILQTEQPSAQVDDAQEGRVHNIVQDVTTNGSDRDLKPDEVLETEQASDGTKEVLVYNI